MAKNDKRLDKLDAAIQAVRPQPTSVWEAVAVFRQSGELPAHDRLAEDVVHHTLRLPTPVSCREQLLREATSKVAAVREPARFVLRALIQFGFDIGSRNFLDEDMELPAFGSLGLHLMGWPEILVRPPYEEQARRVLRNHEALYRRVAGSEQWLRKVADGTRDFFGSGLLPEDTKLRDLVLGYAEFLTLHASLGGEQDDVVLSAFDVVGTAEGETRERAVEQLQALVRQGRAL